MAGWIYALDNQFIIYEICKQHLISVILITLSFRSGHKHRPGGISPSHTFARSKKRKKFPSESILLRKNLPITMDQRCEK
jgi:hypothetical protein